MNQFGNELKKLVTYFHLKYSSVAKATGYDASYISKWINTDIAPSKQAIPHIVKALTKLILTSCSTEQIEAFCSQYNMKDLPLDEALLACINNSLFSPESTSPDVVTKQSAANPVQRLRGDRLQTFYTYLRLLRDETNVLNLYIMGDLLTFEMDDILFLLDLRTYINTLHFTEGSIEFLISADSITHTTDARIMIAFMNLLMIPSRIPVQVCQCATRMTGLIIIADNILYRAQCRMEMKWLLESFSFNSEELVQAEETIRTRLLPTSRQLFTVHNISDFHSSSLPSNSYWGRRERQLIGYLDTLFCAPELLEMIFNAQPQKLSTCLRQKKIFENALKEGQIHQCLLYREALDNLTYKGIVQFYGKEVCLSLPARLSYLQEMAHLLDRYPNLQIRVIDGYVVREIKHRPLPNIFFAKGTCGFLLFPLDGSSQYCLIQNAHFRHALENSFSSLWEGENISLVDLRDILDEYLNFCQDMFPYV